MESSLTKAELSCLILNAIVELLYTRCVYFLVAKQQKAEQKGTQKVSLSRFLWMFTFRCFLHNILWRKGALKNLKLQLLHFHKKRMNIYYLTLVPHFLLGLILFAERRE